MKRNCIFLLASVLLFSLSACTGNKQKSDQSLHESYNSDIVLSETNISENSTAEGASVETVKETQKEATKETTNEAPKETQNEALKETTNETTNETTKETQKEAPNEAPKKTKAVKMTVGKNELYITVYDNPTSSDFLSKLPMTLTFEDYNSTEKISYLPETLTTENAPDSFTPVAGDVALYAPWGNLSVFYKDFRDSHGLVSIGHIDEGIEIFSEINGSFTAVLEIIE